MTKKYKCPYCDDRYEREKLISHVDKKHTELLANGYSSTQAVFDSINHNIEHHGRCRVCNKPTTWNEKSGRYNTLCGDPKCKQKMREEYQKNMIRVRGTDNILNDAKQQEKMLQNRKISGKYKWSTGEEFVYTGQFERKALEFIDQALNIPANDLMVPGPSMKYYYDGKDHIYIPDMYLISFNLLIEVKDGGDNPNNKSSIGMITSREKTLAKEKMVTDKGEFNYIRLTNNNFAQLMEILMQIKMNNIDGIEDKTIRINESYEDEEHMYFYHMVPKNSDMNMGIKSLDWFYKYDKFLFMTYSDKYRNRLVNEWEIYPGENPHDLTLSMVHDGINKFRQSEDGCNQIYFFYYPPYSALGNNMKSVLKEKDIYRIDINDPETAKYIKSIDWGYEFSHTGNKHLTMDWYKNTSHDKYFERYDDDNALLFSTLNHISICPKYGYIPKKCLKKMSAKDINNLNETYISEGVKSTINPNYVPKGKLDLSSFKTVHITESVINKYKKKYKFLSHVRCKDTKEYICDGYIWFDGDELVAMVGSCQYTDDNTKWVVSLEITRNYKGYGLSKQILNYATKSMDCKYLSVNKNNKVAKKVYDDYGFKVYYQDDTMYYMTIDPNAKININESSYTDEEIEYFNNYVK